MDKEKELEILSNCKNICKGTLMEHFGIEFIRAGDDFLVARMPITDKVRQVVGILHGGASAALAESVGSMAAMVLNPVEGYDVLGIEITANHVRGIAEGVVFAKAVNLHNGRTLQLWDIKITDEKDRLISSCKHTTIRVAKKK